MADTPIHFVHIGMPKAASTWLQECLFPRLPAIVLGAGDLSSAVNQRFFAHVRALTELPEHQIDCDRFVRDIDALFGDCLRTGSDEPTDRIFGLSHEVLSGQWLTGRNAAFIARTLHALWPDVRVLLFIRNQPDMLTSSYAQYIRHGGWASFKRFLMDPAVVGGVCRPVPSDGTDQSDGHWTTPVVEYFTYSRLIGLYRDLFGDQLLVECVERLVSDRSAVIERVCRFLGLPVPNDIDDRRTNVQLGRWTLAILCRFNRVFRSPRFGNRGLLPDTLVWWLYRTLWPDRAQRHPMVGSPYMLSAEIQHSMALRIARSLDAMLNNRWIRHSRRDYFHTLPADYRDRLLEAYRQDNRLTQQMIEPDLAAAGYLI